jgi:RND family efflux transporter MFP subunit
MFKRNNLNYYDDLQSLFLLFIASFILSTTVLAQTANSPIPVDVIYPELAESNQTLILTGTVEAKQSAQLAPLEAGHVVILNVEIGDLVVKGQQLLTLDSKLAELQVQGALANVKAAQVNLTEAERLYKEGQKLFQQKVVSKTIIAERAAFLAINNTQLASAQAALSLQQELLNRHSLQAPFNGVIAQRNVDVGEWISQQASAFTLVAQDDLRLTISIPQQYYSRLIKQSNIAVKVLPDSTNSQVFNAIISRFVPVSDMTTRTFIAQIDLPNNIGLVVGMSARANISIPNTNRSSIMLPRSAVKQHPDGGSSVFIAESGVAKRVITNYRTLSGDWVVINNQPANKAYIISGVELLQDGTAVTPNIVESAR